MNDRSGPFIQTERWYFETEFVGFITSLTQIIYINYSPKNT